MTILPRVRPLTDDERNDYDRRLRWLAGYTPLALLRLDFTILSLERLDGLFESIRADIQTMPPAEARPFADEVAIRFAPYVAETLATAIGDATVGTVGNDLAVQLDLDKDSAFVAVVSSRLHKRLTSPAASVSLADYARYILAVARSRRGSASEAAS